MSINTRRFFFPDDFGGLFDDEQLSAATTTQEYKGESNPDFFSPKTDDPKAKGGAYKAAMRFVPNVHDVSKSKISKFIYYFEFDGDKFYVDCLSNFGGKQKNIITEAYFDLYKSGSATLMEISKNFKRKQYHYALAVINDDEQHPELNGKIKIFRFGNQVDELIIDQNTEKPGKTKVNIFNPFTGKDFQLDVHKEMFEGREMTTYKSSYFYDKSSPIKIDGKVVTADSAGQVAVREFLLANSPDLSQVEAKPWDAAMEAKVISTVRGLIGDNNVFNRIYTKVYGKAYVPTEADVAPRNTGGNKPQPKKDQAADTTTTTDLKPTVEAKATDTKADLAETLKNKSATASQHEEVVDEDDEMDFKFEDLPE